MQHLGPEVSQFRRFVEANGLDAARLRASVGIGGHHAVHVSPDLDALGAESGSHNGRRKIRPAAADGGRRSRPRGCDEASHHWHSPALDQRFDIRFQLFIGVLEVRHSAGVSVVRNDAIARIHQRGTDAPRRKRRSHDLAGEQFAIGGDVIRGARGQLTDGSNAPQEFIESIEFGFEFAVKLSKNSRPQQLPGRVVVAFSQVAGELQRGFAVSGARGARRGQQLVGDSGHGANHHRRLLRDTSFDDSSSAVDGRGILDGSAAEFHDQHVGLTSGNMRCARPGPLSRGAPTAQKRDGFGRCGRVNRDILAL